jgi:hypothetical protein
VRPEHLCVTDSISENYIMCSRRSPKQHIHSDIIGRSTLQHVYTEWFSGHPDTCTHKIYINGGTGVCMRPSIRDPSVWNKENFVVLNDVRDDDSTLTCNTTAVHYATQEAQVYPGTPFHSIYFGTSVLRVANIKGKNVYIIGRPSKKQIERVRTRKFLRAQNSTPVISQKNSKFALTVRDDIRAQITL